MKKTRIEKLNPDRSAETKKLITHDEFVIDSAPKYGKMIQNCALILEDDVSLLTTDSEKNDLLNHFDIYDGITLADIKAFKNAYSAARQEGDYYMIVHNIDKLDIPEQNIILGIVKDNDYDVRKSNVAIILTIDSPDRIKNIIPILYNLTFYCSAI